MQGLILDLRGNSGGYFDTAVRIADMFIEDGLIVKKIPRREEAEFQYAHPDGTHPGYPIVILTDGGTASASEIVAGALSDAEHERATIVGARTYGKGSVITMTHSTGGGSQLWFTGAYYVLPSGQYVKDRYRAIKDGRSDWGIVPDAKVALGGREAEDAYEISRVNEMTQRDEMSMIERYTIDETLDGDVQLEIGRLIMLTKLIQAEYE
jgi:carboxyl-terminal processing protease